MPWDSSPVVSLAPRNSQEGGGSTEDELHGGQDLAADHPSTSSTLPRPVASPGPGDSHPDSWRGCSGSGHRDFPPLCNSCQRCSS